MVIIFKFESAYFLLKYILYFYGRIAMKHIVCFIFYYLKCILFYMFCLHVYLCARCVAVAHRNQKRNEIPQNWSSDGSELQYAFKKSNMGSLEQKQVFFTSQSSLQPLQCVWVKFTHYSLPNNYSHTICFTISSSQQYVLLFFF